MSSLQRLWPAAVVVCAAAALTLPAWLWGLPPAGDDGIFHASWLTQFSRQLRAGELYPRWLAGMSGGLGSPVFFYYAPLPYHVASLIGLLVPSGASPLRTLGLTAAVSVAASGLAARSWLKQTAGGAAATVGALLYVAAPYHLALDLYMRDALAELFAFVWMPLALRFAPPGGPRARATWAGLAVAYALLLVSHLPAALIFSAVPAARVLYTTARGARLRALALMLAAMLAGACLAAVYLLPALLTRDAVSMGNMGADLFQRNWLTFRTASLLTHEGKNLWGLLTTLGLIACALAATRNAASQENARGETSWTDSDGAKAREGLSGEEDSIAASSLKDSMGASKGTTGVAAGSRSAFAREGLRGAPVAGSRERRFWIAVACVCVFMMTAASGPVWRLLPTLQNVQFPWRFNLVLCLAAVALVTPALGALRAGWRAGRRRLPVFVCLLVAAWLAFTAASARQAYANRERFDAFTDALHAAVGRGHDASEYCPATALSNSPGYVEDLRKRFCAGGDGAARVCFARGEGAAEVLEWRPRKIVLRAASAGGATLHLWQFYYAGWAARLDGRALPLGHTEIDGLMSLEIPAGEHRVELSLAPRWQERAGWLLSALSAAALLAWNAAPRLRKFARRGRPEGANAEADQAS